jgi:hypothetical protein
VSPWGHKLPFWVGYHHPFPTRMHTGAGRRPSGDRNGAYSYCGAGKRGRL